MIENCIEPVKIYEIVNADLKRIIRDFIKNISIKQFLKQIFVSKRPLIVTPFVMFLALVNQSEPGVQGALLGIDMLISNAKSTSIRFGGGFVTVVGVLLFINNIFVQVFFGFTTTASLLFLGIILRQVDCNQLMHQLPQIPAAVEILVSPSDKAKYLLDITRNKVEEMILLKDF